MSTKSKPRVGVRVKEALGVKKSTNRSADLVALTEDYNKLKTRLKLLVAALKNQHASLIQLNKTRLQVAKHVAALSEKSPIYDCAGLMPSQEIPKESVCSYASVHASMAQRSKMYTDKYSKFVVNYAVEWEKVITERISLALKQAEVLRRDLDHYHKKVESLRQSTNTTMAKGKLVDPKLAEKLSRNEMKLWKARKDYEKFATDLCVLIEEVTERAWKDLHPLLVKLAQFDATLSGDENSVLSNLNLVTQNLKKVAEKHGLKPQARLKDLETLQPQFLSTASAERALENGHRGSITGTGQYDIDSPDSVAAFSSGGLFTPKSEQQSGGMGEQNMNSSFSSMDGIGGGGVATARRSSSMVSTSSNFSSPSDMLAIAAKAAPPPTIEMLNDANNTSSRHSRNESTVPPLPPPGTFGRSHSFQGGASGYDSDSNISTHSLPAAPAPSAPPPPPPPAPGLSMYSSFATPYDDDIPVAPAPSAPPPPPPPASGLSMYSSYGTTNGSSVSSSSNANPPQASTIGYGNYNVSTSAIENVAPPAHPWSTGGAYAGASSAPSSGNNTMSGGRRPSTNPFDDAHPPIPTGTTNPFGQNQSYNPFDH